MNRSVARYGMIFAAAIFALLCVSPVRADTMNSSNELHIAVLLTTDAQLVLNGKPATLDQVKAAVDDMASKGGMFWYARENGQSDPTPKQVELFQALFDYVTQRQLPIRLFTDGTFTQVVDG
jgi:hypothetical protein